MLFSFLQFLLGFFAVAPHYFSRNIVGQFTENRLPEKTLTTYIEYIIAPAPYLQTQTTMGATKKKHTQIRRFLDSGRVVLGGHFVAASERSASSTSRCATPTGTPQARNVVAGVTASSRNWENPFCNRIVVYCSYPFLSIKACRAGDKEGNVARCQS